MAKYTWFLLLACTMSVLSRTTTRFSITGRAVQNLRINIKQGNYCLLSVFIRTTATGNTLAKYCKLSSPHSYTKRYWNVNICLSRYVLAQPTPPICETGVQRLLTTDSGSEGPSDEISESEVQEWYDIDTEELVAMLQAREKEDGRLFLVDVREPEELDEYGEIPGSLNVPLDDVESAFNMSPEDFDTSYGVKRPPMDSDGIVFSCMGGIRSRVAMEVVHQLGYTNARHYMRGWIGWEEYLDQARNTDSNKQS